MRIRTRLNDNSRPVLILVLTLALGALLVLPGCDVNVKKDSEGKEKNVDIETPVGGLHATKEADVRDIGLPAAVKPSESWLWDGREGARVGCTLVERRSALREALARQLAECRGR